MLCEEFLIEYMHGFVNTTGCSTFSFQVTRPPIEVKGFMLTNSTSYCSRDEYGLPVEIQKLRCRVNFHGLRFTPQIEETGRKLVRILREKGPFIVLHLRYEMDMLAFSGCSHGCTSDEEEELNTMRYANPLWKEKDIDSEMKRVEGLCPLTPEETALVLAALGIDHKVQIYIVAGEIYGGDRRMEGA